MITKQDISRIKKAIKNKSIKGSNKKVFCTTTEKSVTFYEKVNKNKIVEIDKVSVGDERVKVWTQDDSLTISYDAYNTCFVRTLELK